jgi:hypothetical protein
MLIDEYMSEEELEDRFEQELEDEDFLKQKILELEFEEFLVAKRKTSTAQGKVSTPKDISREKVQIKAKRLWIGFSEMGISVPEEVTKVMIEIITKEVEKYDLDHPNELRNKKNTEEDLYDLLHVAKTNLNLFWKLLHEPQSVWLISFYNVELLDTLRRWLPERRTFKPKEVYSIFEGLRDKEDKPKCDYKDAFAQEFRRWKKKNVTRFKKKKTT